MQHTIVIAEDDPFIQKLLGGVLQREGYHIRISADGKGFYDEAPVLPSLFILDKQLLETDGLELCRYLKSKRDTMRIPVIIMSAMPEIGRLAEAAGADDFIQKPFTAALLVDKIKKILSERQDGV